MFNLTMSTLILIVYDYTYKILGLKLTTILFILMVILSGICISLWGMLEFKKVSMIYVVGALLWINIIVFLIISLSTFTQHITEWIEIRYKLLDEPTQKYIQENMNCCIDDNCGTHCFTLVKGLILKITGICNKLCMFSILLTTTAIISYINKYWIYALGFCRISSIICFRRHSGKVFP